jgi:glutamate/tyrosine decarboxylase-like PLP-dependent enzyme
MKDGMHALDMDLIEMTMDIMKYAIGRVSDTSPTMGYPQKEEELQEIVGETVTEDGIGGEKAFSYFKNVLLKATVPVDHPRHLAFVPAAPTRAAVLFDLITSASSIHGAYWMTGAGGIYCENQAMQWIVSLTGLPDSAFGVFTSGGTAANLSAMVTARETWREENEENRALRGLIITSNGAHSSVKNMAKVIDADILLVDDDEEDKLNGKWLQKKINGLSEIDRKRLFAVVATGGTTNAGVIDKLDSVADVCEKENLWFHVDAAYGGGALAAPSVRHFFKGIERADSITIDPHKWLFSPYDCGAIIYKNPDLARNAHAQQGSYLDVVYQDSRGFNPEEYQIQLTRRLRGLPLWFSLAVHGTKKYTEAIERGLELAQIAADKIQENDNLKLVREPSLSCVLFSRKGWEDEDYNRWTRNNQKKGFALVTPTKWRKNGTAETVTRFCFINPDTTEEDIDAILETME